MGNNHQGHNDTDDYVGIAEYLAEHHNGENHCELCGHLLEASSSTKEVPTVHNVEERIETLHWLWHLCKQHPDRAYILLARLIGGMDVLSIAKNMSGRSENPTGATVSMIASSMTDDILQQVGDAKQVQQIVKKQLGNGKLKIHTHQGNKRRTKTDMQRLITKTIWDCI